jgi:hypothetical protein
VLAREALRERIRLGVDDEVDLALAVQRDLLVAVRGDRREAHRLEQLASATGSGAAYSTNSKPSVPIGLSQGVNCMRSWHAVRDASETVGSSPAVLCKFASCFGSSRWKAAKSQMENAAELDAIDRRILRALQSTAG